MCLSIAVITQLTKPSTQLDTSPKSEPALELYSRAAPSVEAHHHTDGPDAGRISGGRRKKITFCAMQTQSNIYEMDPKEKKFLYQVKDKPIFCTMQRVLDYFITSLSEILPKHG